MRYWMTTKWPPRVYTNRSEVLKGVHIADGKETAVSGMNSGDLVFTYETKTGRSEIENTIDGEKNIIRRHRGKGGIVVLSEIITRPYEIEDSELTKYTNGTKIWWRYCADTKTINSNGFIPREKVNEVLGYKKNYTLKGFGTKQSGVKEITQQEYRDLLQYFLKENEKENEKLKEKHTPASTPTLG